MQTFSYEPTSDKVLIQFSTLNLCEDDSQGHCDTLNAD